MCEYHYYSLWCYVHLTLPAGFSEFKADTKRLLKVSMFPCQTSLPAYTAHNLPDGSVKGEFQIQYQRSMFLLFFLFFLQWIIKKRALNDNGTV